MAQKEIVVRGAREHNLQNVDLNLPRHQFIVLTGPSGSGKSSMAFDTIFSEARRRYLDSLSVYARQFIGEMRRPDVDDLQGLGPAIAIDQKTSGHNPRSTVGTITEVYDFMRVLWSNIGAGEKNAPAPKGPEGTLVRLLLLPEKSTLLVLAPLVRNRKGMFKTLIKKLQKKGFSRLRVDGVIEDLCELEALRKTKRHQVDLVIDRLRIKDGKVLERRLRDALLLALIEGSGEALVEATTPEGQEIVFELSDVAEASVSSAPSTLSGHGLSAQHFSFNSPLGMCEHCKGLGRTLEMDPLRVAPDHSLSLAEGAIAPWSWKRNKQEIGLSEELLDAVLERLELDRERPLKSFGSTQLRQLLFGIKAPVKVRKKRGRAHEVPFGGILGSLLEQYRSTYSGILKEYLAQFIVKRVCPKCDGARLNPRSRGIKIGEGEAAKSISEVNEMPISDVIAFFQGLSFSGARAIIAGELVPEILQRLGFLEQVGLTYLQLSRSGPTLSGGESQRIRLATQLGSALSGVLYVLDEPSIGLHPRDHRRLIKTLQDLRDQGNTILVVEHDADTMRAADYLVDFGPGAGVEGGQVVFMGSPDDVLEAKGSITADYLSGRRKIEVPTLRRKGEGELIVRGASANNLKGFDVHFPLKTFTCVTGVSGAGKSTLVNKILYPAALNAAQRTQRAIASCKGVEGLGVLDRVIEIDQRPIGRTPRSNPATYTKVFDQIRQLFAKLPESQIYGYKAGRFSFNVKGGRCETCKGAGIRTLEMQFLSDVYIPCEVCGGRRFNEVTLRVKYRGHSISDVLAMNLHEALELFSAHPKIHRIFQTMIDVGLGYLTLGQPSPTLSGGEAQRVKLSKELARPALGHTLYIMDEPSTGLHFEDVRQLLAVVDRLVEAGNTVVMIEHNIDIIKVADHLIDLGPEGGKDGGGLIAQGPPEVIAKNKKSHTGRYLSEVL